jgi:hypothetical protein
MSIWSIAFPFEAAVSVAGFAIGAARPLIGVSIFATLLLLFKPLLKGLMQAGLLLLSPRKSLDERRLAQKVRGIRLVNAIASDYESSQPNLAAELRQLASRG